MGLPLLVRSSAIIFDLVTKLVFLSIQQCHLRAQLIDLASQIVIVLNGLSECRHQIHHHQHAERVDEGDASEVVFAKTHMLTDYTSWQYLPRPLS